MNKRMGALAYFFNSTEFPAIFRSKYIEVKEGMQLLISYLFLEISTRSINKTLKQSIIMYLSYSALKMSFRVLNGLGLKQMPDLQSGKFSLCSDF